MKKEPVDRINDWRLWCVSVMYNVRKRSTAEPWKYVTEEWTEDPFFVRGKDQDYAVHTITELAAFAGHGVVKIVMEEVTA